MGTLNLPNNLKTFSSESTMTTHHFIISGFRKKWQKWILISKRNKIFARSWSDHIRGEKKGNRDGGQMEENKILHRIELLTQLPAIVKKQGCWSWSETPLHRCNNFRDTVEVMLGPPDKVLSLPSGEGGHRKMEFREKGGGGGKVNI